MALKWYDYASGGLTKLNEPLIKGVGNLFKSPDVPQPGQLDITAQLAMIDEAYNQQKQQAQTTLAESLKGQNRLTAQSLAGRGIYSSPVSQFSFGKNQKSYAQALSQALSDLGAQQAIQKNTIID